MGGSFRRRTKVLGLAVASLLICCGIPVGMLHSLASSHRALFEFVGRKWIPFFEALWRLRSVPAVSQTPPVPGAKGRYEVGIAYKWQVGDTTGIDLTVPESSSSDPLEKLMPQMIKLCKLELITGTDFYLPLVEGVHRIEAWTHWRSQACYVGWRCTARNQPTDMDYHLSVPLIAVLDAEVYPFSSNWERGAIIWAWHRWPGWEGPASDFIFVAGVTKEVASAVEEAVEILVELGEPTPRER